MVASSLGVPYSPRDVLLLGLQRQAVRPSLVPLGSWGTFFNSQVRPSQPCPLGSWYPPPSLISDSSNTPAGSAVPSLPGMWLLGMMGECFPHSGSTNSGNLIHKEFAQISGFCSEFPQKPCLSHHSFPGVVKASRWLLPWGGARVKRWRMGST